MLLHAGSGRATRLQISSIGCYLGKPDRLERPTPARIDKRESYRCLLREDQRS